jgi:histidinol-phosphate/aromatic aminotransferase/cobyric acid decarboxylase-like protein
MLEARSAVRSLHSYRPPLAGRQGLRFDFNENTVGCSPRVLARLRSLDAEVLARYPEREPVEQHVATFLSLEKERSICCAPPISDRTTKRSSSCPHSQCTPSLQKPRALA